MGEQPSSEALLELKICDPAMGSGAFLVEACRFVADQVISLNATNPQMAARMVSSFNRWPRYDAGRRSLMRAELERIAAVDDLSPDVFEIVSNALKLPAP